MSFQSRARAHKDPSETIPYYLYYRALMPLMGKIDFRVIINHLKKGISVNHFVGEILEIWLILYVEAHFS